ncbi:MAG: MOP flippase family protein [Bacteroidales bacterium]|nr:MOP flippase family protein [Bacteroidales bacterium]
MSLRSQSVKGVKWNAVGTLTTTALQMLKLFILARVLTKQDFGLLAIATMFLGFTEIFANMGLATGIIHKQDITRDQYSSVFWLNLMLSVGLYLLLCAFTPLIANYYHQPDLRRLIPLLSFTLVIDSFGKMFYTLKTKELDFRFISIVQIVGVTLGVVLTVALALLGHGVFSLAWGAILQAVITQVVYAISGMKAYRIRMHFRLGEIRELVSIGLYQLGMQVVDYAANKLDIFLIGRFFSAEVLGVYNLAKELLYKAVQLINPIVTNVAAPAFARFQDDKEKMRRSYAEVLHLLSFVNFPIFMAFFLFAEPLTVLFYGGSMVEMVWFVRVLSVWGMLQSIGNPAGILMVSLGRTDLGFKWTLVRIVFVLAGTLIASQISIQTMAWTQVILAFIFLFAYWRMMVYKCIQIPLGQYLGAVAWPLLSIIVAALPALPALFFSAGQEEPLRTVMLYADIAVFGLAYLAFYWFTRREILLNLPIFKTKE